MVIVFVSYLIFFQKFNNFRWVQSSPLPQTLTGQLQRKEVVNQQVKTGSHEDEISNETSNNESVQQKLCDEKLKAGMTFTSPPLAFTYVESHFWMCSPMI